MIRIEAEADSFLNGRLRLLQPPRGHRAGTDAILLAAASGIEKGRVVDLGAGVGAVGLAIARTHPQVEVLLVENHATTLALAERNIELNGLESRVAARLADIFAPAKARRAAGLPSGLADLVVANPPFGSAAGMRASPDAARAVAHVMPEGGLAGWIGCAADLLKPRGSLVVIHRADALPEIFSGLARAFGGCVLRPVHPRAGEPAHRILIRAVKGGRAPLAILPGLVLHEAGGRFTGEADAIHRGEAMISL